MSSDLAIAAGATVRKLTWSSVSIVLCALVTLAPAPLANSASAAGTPSTLCSGYVGCTQGSFSTHGYQNASAASFWKMYAGNNCTNYVAYVESTTFQVPTPTYDLGNGGQWAASAAAHGVVVNDVPSVGAVAVWTGAMSGMPASGHVAVVEAVGPRDSYVVISQQHMIGLNGYDWVRITHNPAGNTWQDWPTSFIHFPSPTATAIQAAVSHLLHR